MYTLIQEDLLKAITETLNPPWYDSAVVIALVSGSIVALSSYITTLVNRKTEEKRMSHELNIKNSELEQHRKDRIHDRQLQAFDEYLSIYHDIVPTIWPNSDYTYEDVKITVFKSLNTLLSCLALYMSKNRSILPQDIVSTIDGIIFICNLNQENVARLNSPDIELSEDEISSADHIIVELGKVNDQFRAYLGI